MDSISERPELVHHDLSAVTSGKPCRFELHFNIRGRVQHFKCCKDRGHSTPHLLKRVD